MNKLPAFCFLAAIFFLSCKTPSTLSKTPATNSTHNNSASTAVLDSMRAHSFHFDWFSGKAKIEITQGTEKTEFTASIRIHNDSAVWVSISPALGIEVGRILMTKDSIRVIDRLNKKYYSRDYNFFKTYSSLPIDLETVQNIIEGNPLFTDGKQFEVASNDSSYLLQWADNLQSNSITLDHHFMNQLQNIKDSSSGSLTVTLQQYDIQYTPPFSLWRKIDLHNPAVTQIVVTFSKIKINEPVKLPFNVKDQQ